MIDSRKSHWRLANVATVIVLTVIVLATVACNREQPIESRVPSAKTRSSFPKEASVPKERPVVSPKIDIETNLRQAETLIIEGKPQQGQKVLRESLLVQPDHWPSVFLLAQAESQLGHRSEAIELLAEIPADDPTFGVAAVGQRAQWLAGLGKVVQARDLYEQLLKRDPGLSIVRHQLADLLNKVGWRYQADRVLKPLVSSGEATEDELRVCMNLAVPYVQTLPPTPPGTRPRIEGPLSRAIGLLEAGKPRDAAEGLGDWLKLHQTDAAATAALARSLAEVREFDELGRLFARMGRSVDSYPNYWIALGDYATEMEDNIAAIAAYRRALALDSTHQAGHKRLVAALVVDSKIEAARRLDDRYFRLRAATKAAMAVGAGKPSDEPAGRDLVMDLVAVGELELAIAWLEQLKSRRIQSDEFANWLSEKTSMVQRIGDKEVDLRRFCGVSEGEDSVIEHLQETLPHRPELHDSRREKRLVADSLEAEFVDVAEASGLRHAYRNNRPARLKNLRMFEQVGGGVAALDFDLDGWVDFYCNQADMNPQPMNTPQSPEPSNVRSDNSAATSGVRNSNSLFRQEDHRFVSIADFAGANDTGYGLGVTAGDWNQDGFADLVVGNLGVNRLYLNQADGTFRAATFPAATFPESTFPESWENARFTMGVALADLNADGLSDLVEVNYVQGASVFEPLPLGPDGNALNYAGPLQYASAPDRVWITGPTGQLAGFDLGSSLESQSLRGSASQKSTSEIGDSVNPGLGLIVSELNGEPGLDIFVANDLRPNQLWTQKNPSIGDATPRFVDQAIVSGCAFSSRGQSNACMGVAMGDFDTNMMPDLLVTNWENEWVNLFLQRTPGQFRDVAPSYRLDTLSEGLLGFGTQALDYDHNGTLDLVIANGHIDDLRHRGQTYRMPAQLLANEGGYFVDAIQRDSTYWDRDHLGRCVITCDYNRDGRGDVVIADLHDPVALLENRTASDYQFLQIELIGVSCERDAIGTRVEVIMEDNRFVQVTATGDGYQGRNERLLTFGLGERSEPVSVSVTWPNGDHSQFENLMVDRRYLLIEGVQEAHVRQP